jgi:hypothetical protein
VSEGQLPTGPFVVTNLPLPGSPTGTRVDVAPHLVGYDPDRQLWFADIVIDPGVHYMPMIRLALARYQPISATNAHLSSVVRTEVLQLTNDRLATVTHGDALTYRVRLFGETAPRIGSVDLTVEHLTADGDEDFGWRVLDGVIIRDPALTPTSLLQPTDLVSPNQPRINPDNLTARSLVIKRDFATLLKDHSAILALAMPDIADKEVILPRAAETGERFRLVMTEHEQRPSTSGEAIGEDSSGYPRVVYLEIFDLKD